jgi:hypothetical protein
VAASARRTTYCSRCSRSCAVVLGLAHVNGRTSGPDSCLFSFFRNLEFESDWDGAMRRAVRGLCSDTSLQPNERSAYAGRSPVNGLRFVDGSYTYAYLQSDAVLVECAAGTGIYVRSWKAGFASVLLCVARGFALGSHSRPFFLLNARGILVARDGIEFYWRASGYLYLIFRRSRLNPHRGGTGRRGKREK